MNFTLTSREIVLQKFINVGIGWTIRIWMCAILNRLIKGVWGRGWRIGRVDTFRPKGHGLDSRSSHHVGTLGKSFTHSCLQRFGVKLAQYPCFVGSASDQWWTWRGAIEIVWMNQIKSNYWFNVRTFIRSCFVSSGFLIVLFSGSYSGQKRNEVFAYIIA